MSHTADFLSQAEQEAAWRELSLWHAGCVLKDALREGDEQAAQILTELEHVEKDKP